jgi:hypothetical protein
VATTYFSSFTLVTRDVDGYVGPLPEETLSIYDDTDTLVTTVDSDEFGFVESIGITSPSAEVYFKHASYPEEFHQTTAADEDEALRLNINTQFIVDDDFITTTETTEVDLWLHYPDEPTFQPIKIGMVQPGSSLKYPLESFYSKTVRVSAIPRTDDFSQVAGKLADAPYSDFSLDSIDPALDAYVPTSTDDATYTASGDVTDHNELIIGNSGSAIALDLLFSAGFFSAFIFKNIGAGTVTLTSDDGDTFNGEVSVDIEGGTQAVFVSTGLNWLRIL